MIANAAEQRYLPGKMSEDAIAALDRAARMADFDDDLLRCAPARDMRTQIHVVIALLQKLDGRHLLAKQGFLAHFTGADVEARLQFELASQKVLSAASQLRLAAQNGIQIRALLHEAGLQIRADIGRLEQTIGEAQRLLESSSGADDFTVARFERRLASIIALQAANTQTVVQISLAETVLSGLLDRFNDVDTLLLPVWQRNALAVAHAPVGALQRTAFAAFLEIHRALIAFLQQDDQ